MTPAAHTTEATPWAALRHLARTNGAPLLTGRAEPHVDLLTLLWSPQFDRGYGDTLCQQAPSAQRAALRPCLATAAALFDQLGPPAQQHARQLVWRHWQHWQRHTLASPLTPQ